MGVRRSPVESDGNPTESGGVRWESDGNPTESGGVRLESDGVRRSPMESDRNKGGRVKYCNNPKC
jgi:hypothetical protein